MGSAGAVDLSAISCRENLGSFGRYYGLKGQALKEAIAWCLDWAALEDKQNDVVKTLSGGMKRRLNMAAGMMHRPKVVLLDEPTVGVDPQSRNRIFEMIEALRDAGTAIIYTTHYMEEAERLCDRIAIIDHGQIIAQGTKEELVAGTFRKRSQVLARFAGAQGRYRGMGGVTADERRMETAEFTMEQAGGDCRTAGGCDEGRAGAAGCIAAEAESGVGFSAPDRKGVATIDCAMWQGRH